MKIISRVPLWWNGIDLLATFDVPEIRARRRILMSVLEQQRRRIFLTPSQATNMLAFILALAAVLSIAQAAGAQTFRLLYQFKSGPDGDNPYASLILDPQGNLYGTTMIDGAYSYGTVFKLSPDGKETVLHSFTGTGGDGANPVAPLIRDAAGNLYGSTEYGGLFGDECGGKAAESYSSWIRQAKKPCYIASPESLVSTG